MAYYENLFSLWDSMILLFVVVIKDMLSKNILRIILNTNQITFNMNDNKMIVHEKEQNLGQLL